MKVRNWLLVVYAMIAGMVLIGGITRLTGSGLSMVEWHPLMGALPPMGDAQWHSVFEKYQASPQYQQVNQWMTLADFKRIFFWEWFHRLFGRLIGLVFFVPWVVFLIRGTLKGSLLKKTGLAFVLGGLQGLLGWFMVKSGLVDMPQVSHYRLAAHLSLALVVACYVAWLAFDLTWPRVEPSDKAKNLVKWVWGSIALVALQTVYGAFMAGSRAGYLFSTFPDMNGEYLPFKLMQNTTTAMNYLDHPVAIHFMHRNLAYVATIAVLGVWVKGRNICPPRARLGLNLMAAMVLTQLTLGIWTVMSGVQLHVAVAHQGGALLLLTFGVFTAHALRKA